MKIRIIELLEMIANGQKPPKKIAFREQEYEYDIGERDYYYCNGAIYWLFDEYVITDILNEEVEILETTITYNQDNIENNKQDNKIEKLNIALFDDDNLTTNNKLKHIAFRVNEIIEVLNDR